MATPPTKSTDKPVAARRSRKPASKPVEASNMDAMPVDMTNTPNPQAAVEIESVSQGHMAEVVAHAPHGTNEESDYAPLPESYPYRTRIRRKD